MVRYTDYNRTTYDLFVDYLGRYLFQEVCLEIRLSFRRNLLHFWVSFYGYCLWIARPNADKFSWRIDIWHDLEAIHKQLYGGLEVFNEPRPPPRPILSTATTSTTKLPSEMPISSTTSAFDATPTFEVIVTAIDQATDRIAAP